MTPFDPPWNPTNTSYIPGDLLLLLNDVDEEREIEGISVFRYQHREAVAIGRVCCVLGALLALAGLCLTEVGYPGLTSIPFAVILAAIGGAVWLLKGRPREYWFLFAPDYLAVSRERRVFWLSSGEVGSVDTRSRRRWGRLLEIGSRSGDVARFESEFMEGNPSLWTTAYRQIIQVPERMLVDVRTGDVDAVRDHLDESFDPLLRTPGGASPLHVAAAHGRREWVSLLLDAGVDVLAADRLGRDALMVAACRGDARMAQALLQAGASARTTDRNGRSALFFACLFAVPGETGYKELVTRLLTAGADPSEKDSDHLTALSVVRDPELRERLEKYGQPRKPPSLENMSPAFPLLDAIPLTAGGLRSKPMIELLSTPTPSDTPTLDANGKSFGELVNLIAHLSTKDRWPVRCDNCAGTVVFDREEVIRAGVTNLEPQTCSCGRRIDLCIVNAGIVAAAAGIQLVRSG